jgi:hypothetical protein
MTLVPALIAVGTLALAVLAVAFPLATYAVSLALFGLPHVVSELRYVDLRFSERYGRGFMGAVGVGLLAVVLTRVATLSGVMDKGIGVALEMGLASLLVLPVAWRTLAQSVRMLMAVTAGSLLLIAATVAPLHAFLLLAVLHNLTPLGFLTERWGQEERPKLWAAVVAMVGVPALILTGWPHAALASLGLVQVDASPIPVGSLGGHLGAFIHRDFHTRWWAPHLFAAAAFGQCTHYVATLHVLPRQLPADARGLAPWPSTGVVVGALALASLGLFPAWVRDFSHARSLYGVLASVHVWLELPVLLAAALDGRGLGRTEGAR